LQDKRVCFIAATQGVCLVKPLKPRRRGIYLLPNMITISALFCGFYAIVMSLNLEFWQSTVAIFIGMILDSMDGRVARFTRTQSEFGAQLDSLSDMVTFGVAPALVAYEWSLKGMGRVGWVAAFVYCACAALRLARFNTNITVVDKRFFQGLPSPAAAAIVAGFIWLMDDLGFSGRDFYWTCWCITLYAGLTMVTNVPFYSFKEMNVRKSVPFIVVILLVLIIVTISFDPPKVLFGLFVLYGISGYIVYVWHKFKGKQVSLVQTEEDVEATDSKSG
jgi:CDP-diacylglycerol--serine O-phosphatidyltransferase